MANSARSLMALFVVSSQIFMHVPEVAANTPVMDDGGDKRATFDLRIKAIKSFSAAFENIKQKRFDKANAGFDEAVKALNLLSALTQDEDKFILAPLPLDEKKGKERVDMIPYLKGAASLVNGRSHSVTCDVTVLPLPILGYPKPLQLSSLVCVLKSNLPRVDA